MGIGGDEIMKVYSLLTGRGNNSLKDKNVLDVLGKPVLYYPAKAVSDSKYVTKNFCSSDDEKILNAAAEVGFTPIVRPKEIAGPTAQHIDCIMHGLKVIEETADRPDILVVTLANNVTIKTEWVDDCVKMMMDDMSISAVVPAYVDNDHHPFRAKKLDENGYLIPFVDSMPKKVSTNRQDLVKSYFLAHNIWVLNVEKLYSDEEGQAPWSFMGNKIVPYEIEESLDIHDVIDLVVAREWIKNNI